MKRENKREVVLIDTYFSDRIAYEHDWSNAHWALICNKQCLLYFEIRILFNYKDWLVRTFIMRDFRADN